MAIHNMDDYTLINHLQNPCLAENQNRPFHEHTVRLHKYLCTVYEMLQTTHHDEFQAAIAADHKLAYSELKPLQIPPNEESEHDKEVALALQSFENDSTAMKLF